MTPQRRALEPAASRPARERIQARVAKPDAEKTSRERGGPGNLPRGQQQAGAHRRHVFEDEGRKKKSRRLRERKPFSDGLGRERQGFGHEKGEIQNIQPPTSNFQRRQAGAALKVGC